MDSHYDVLGIDPNATSQEIRAAWREKAKKLHPDTNDDPYAHEQFIRAKKANEILSNPRRRARYDRIHGWTRSDRANQSRQTRQSSSEQQEEADEEQQEEQETPETTLSWWRQFAWRFGDAILYARYADTWINPVLIGGALIYLSPYIIPAVLVPGYLARVFRSTAIIGESMPSFDHWRATFVDGFRVSASIVIYLSIPLIILTIVVLVGPPIIAFLIAIPVIIIPLYVVPAALAIVVETESVRSGFHTSPLWSVISRDEYAVGWTTLVALILLSMVLVWLFNSLPEPWRPIGAFVQMYLLIAASHAFGHTWIELKHQ